MKLLLGLLLSVSLFGSTVVNVACGSAGDTGFTGGSRWTGVAISARPAPYNAMRSSSPLGAPFSYSFTLQPGQYTVTLMFLEPRADQTAGQRLLNVAFNGAAAITGLDLFSQVGALNPYSASFPITLTGALKIDFSATAGNAVVSGIQIDAADVPLTVNPTGQCEAGIGATYRTTSLNQSGNMFTGTYAGQFCENMSRGPRRLTRVRCRADVAGQLCDVLVPDATGNFASILAAPIVATPTGSEGSVVPGASYQDGQALEFAISVVYSAPQTATWVLASLVWDTNPPPVATLRECQGSGPGWNCAGLLWATIPLSAGTVELVGTDMPAPTKGTWVDRR